MSDTGKLSQEQQWREWMIAAQNGDQRAYSSLLSALAPYIRNIVISSLSNPDAAEDIAQEVLISIHKSLKTYAPDRPFKPWLMAIVNFRRTDYLRKHYSSKKDMQTSIDDNYEFDRQHVTNPQHAGEYKDIEKALAALPDQQRRIFQMMKIEGYTAQEVANEMGMNVSAVKVSAHRTMKKIQGMLE